MSDEVSGPGDESEEVPARHPWGVEGDDGQDATEWLLTFVRAHMAEHFSSMYDVTPMGAVEVIVRLTLYGLHQISEPPVSPPSPPEDNPTLGV